MFFLLNMNWILIAAAVIPAIVLLVMVYRMDRLEKESRGLLLKLVGMGILSALIALVLEKIGTWVLDRCFSYPNTLYYVLTYFVVVALSEEGAKYFLMNRMIWRNPEFNCQFDGIVYAVFVSLGFALWENIQYVLAFGFQTALVRAVTAIPGHACFGVFMGVWYGLAKRMERRGQAGGVTICRCLCLVFPVLLHGTYDYIAVVNMDGGSLYFFAFILVMFGLAFWMVRRASRKDTYI